MSTRKEKCWLESSSACRGFFRRFCLHLSVDALELTREVERPSRSPLASRDFCRAAKKRLLTDIGSF